jgi:hypothetical protein
MTSICEDEGWTEWCSNIPKLLDILDIGGIFTEECQFVPADASLTR